MNLHRRFRQITREQSLELARRSLIEIVKRKFGDASMEPSLGLIEALVDHGLSGEQGNFVWENASEELRAFLAALELTEEDQALLDAEQADFLGELTTVLEDTARRTAKELFTALWQKWPEMRDYNVAVSAGFEGRLEARWGKSFDLLRMMLHMSYEQGGAELKRLRRSRAKRRKLLPHLLLRLHTRACQVVGEILALMSVGFADGAMARWRTLHEITVVALLIVEGGEDLACRYADHEVVSKYKAALLHQTTCKARGDRPFSERTMNQAKAAYDAVLLRYGKTFKGEYGWASAYLKNADPKFSHLEDAAGHASRRPDYKMASYNVHAGSRGIFFKLGTMDGSGFMAGASDAGFEEPGCATADAIVQINAVLMSQPPTFDELIILWTLANTRDAARKAFADAARKLRRDHAQIQEERKASLLKRKSRMARRPATAGTHS